MTGIEAALVFSYFFNSTQPLYFGDDHAGPHAKAKATIELRQALPLGFYAQVKPYTFWGDEIRMGQYGAEAWVGWRWAATGLTFSYYHHSSHNADVGEKVRFHTEGIEARWELQ